MMENFGKILILFGVIFILSGLMFYFISSTNINFFKYFKFLGHLPGDIVIKKENFSFYFPLTTSILITILLNLILYFLFKLIK